MEITNKDLFILPLGGIEEIGINCTLYYYHGHLIVIDYGISLYVIDDLTPYQVIYLNLHNMIANLFKVDTVHLIITHCHDDHIGGFKYLANALTKEIKYKIKTYVSHRFNIDMIEAKNPYISKILEFINVGYDNTYYLDDDIEFTFYQVDHSIPHSAGIFLKFKSHDIDNNKDTCVYHSGDWRFRNVVSHDVVDAKQFKRLSDNQSTHSDTVNTLFKVRNKCNIVLNESTNIGRQVNQITEQEVLSTLEKVILKNKQNNKRTYITCFSSSVMRINSVIDIARKNAIKICYIGRALSQYISVSTRHNIISAANQDYITCVKSLSQIQAQDYKIIILSGCQNEPGAALNRIAYSSKKALSGNDVVVFSATAIPTAIKRIEHLCKTLSRLKVSVFTKENLQSIHCSGHAQQNDIINMYNILGRIDYIIPIHGNIAKIHKHCSLVSKYTKAHALRAARLKIFKFFFRKGSLAQQSSILSSKYYAEKVMLDYRVVDIDDKIVAERKKLIQGGAVIISARNQTVQTIGTQISDKTINKAKSILRSREKDYKEKIYPLFASCLGVVHFVE